MKMVSKKSLSIVLLMFLIALPLASAFEFDNWQFKQLITFDGKQIKGNSLLEQYKPIEIKNAFGFGETLFEGYLSQHDDVCGVDCQSTIQIKLNQDSVLIDEVDFYTIKDDGLRIKQDVRSYQFYVDDVPYSLGTSVPSGTYEVRLEAEKKPSRTVDWVIETQGETLYEWAEWGATFIGSEYQLIILADSAPGATGDIIVTELSSGTFKINSSNADDEVSRALVMEWLFYDGKASDFTNPTYVYTNKIEDDRKRGHYITATVVQDGVNARNTENVIGTFADTSTNTNCSSWSYVSATVGSASSVDDVTARWEIPEGTTKNTVTRTIADGTTEVDELGTDLSADEANNPANCEIYTTNYDSTYAINTMNALAKVVVLCNGNISWVESGSDGSYSIIDFYLNESFPLMTYSNASMTLESPTDDYISSISEITFNCSATVPIGITLTNISLWHNATGTWILNQTNIVDGTSNSTTFDLTLVDEEYIDWTCQGGDSDGDSGYATENRTVGIDTSSPTINITYPTTSFDYGYLGENITLNWTSTDTHLESCWFNYNNTNITVTCTNYNASFIFEDGNQTLTFYANDSVGNEANYTRDWTYSIFENLETYNSSSTETATEGFRINITATGSQTILANLSYNGTIYSTTKVGNNSEMEFYKDFGALPVITTSTATNHSFFWEVYYGAQNINTTVNNQTVERIYLDLCNATLTVPYINFTFEDEETTIATNATMDTSTWYYYLGDGTVNKSLLYSTTTANESYGFCFTPTDKTMKNIVELQYSDTGYPQRRWTSTTSLTNTTTNQKLYMLASADGTYSVYQVQTSTGSGISGVTVQAERQFAGVWTLVEEGTTDSAGGFTAWLNPDFDHRLTFIKSGYTSVQVTVRPSSSTYTVVMGTGEEEATYNSSMEGLSWKIYPDLGKILFPNTTQTFLFNITANLSNIISCKMEIINNNSVSLGTTTGCTSQGGNLSLAIPLGTNRSVRGVYSVDIGEGYFVLDADAYWIVMTTDIPERGTIVSFFKYARNLNEFGNDENRQEFSRIVLFFLILMITMASISKTTGWDLATMGGSIVFISFIVWFASYGGFLTLSYTGVNGWMDQYVVALITSLFAGGYALNKIGRES